MGLLRLSSETQVTSHLQTDNSLSTGALLGDVTDTLLPGGRDVLFSPY